MTVSDQTHGPRLERAVALLGSILVVGLVIVLAKEAFFGKNGKPDIVIRVKTIERLSHSFLVTIEIKNVGGSAASQVPVHAILSGNAEDEDRRITVDYVPEGSSREAGFFFRNDPAQGHFSVWAEGFQIP